MPEKKSSEFWKRKRLIIPDDAVSDWDKTLAEGGVTEDERKNIFANTNENFSNKVDEEEREREMARRLLGRDGSQVAEEDIKALLKKWRGNRM